MPRSTDNTPLIRYYHDDGYKNRDELLKYHEIGVTADGTKTVFRVLINDGKSVECMMEFTFEALERVRTVAAANVAWSGAARFRQLEMCLTGRAAQAFTEEVAAHYSQANQKTHNNYNILLKRIISKVSPHENPGNRIHTFVTKSIQYKRCKMDD